MSLEFRSSIYEGGNIFDARNTNEVGMTPQRTFMKIDNRK